MVLSQCDRAQMQWLDGDPAIGSHLRVCETCRRAVKNYARIIASLAIKPPTPGPRGGWKRFEQRLQAFVQVAAGPQVKATADDVCPTCGRPFLDKPEEGF